MLEMQVQRLLAGVVAQLPEHLAAMVDALNSTPPRPLDSKSMSDALGPAWPDLPVSGAPSGGRRGRRRGA